MANSNYQKLSRMLNLVRVMLPQQQHYHAQLTRSKLACAVDNNVNLHLLRCGISSSDPGLAYAVLNENDEKINWISLSPPILQSAFPTLSIKDDLVYGSVAGFLKKDKIAEQLNRYQGHFFALGIRPQFLGTYAQPINSAIKIAASSINKIYSVTTSWFPPVAMLSCYPVLLALHQHGESSILNEKLGGNIVAGNLPTIYALYITAQEEIHLIYDGYCENSRETEKELWYLTLTAHGQLKQTQNLGIAPRLPLISEIISSPEGKLFHLIISINEEDQKSLISRLVPLNGIDSKLGQAEYYFIDYWLQLYEVIFDGDEVHCNVPDKLFFAR